jgi:hypothetical protein
VTNDSSLVHEKQVWRSKDKRENRNRVLHGQVSWD